MLIFYHLANQALLTSREYELIQAGRPVGQVQQHLPFLPPLLLPDELAFGVVYHQQTRGVFGWQQGSEIDYQLVGGRIRI